MSKRMSPRELGDRIRALQEELIQLRAQARGEALELWDEFTEKLAHIESSPMIYSQGWVEIARSLRQTLEDQRKNMEKLGS